MKYNSTVQKHHSFFWRTKLSLPRMREISDWIGSLNKDDKDKLNDLFQDYKEDIEWDCYDSYQ